MNLQPIAERQAALDALIEKKVQQQQEDFKLDSFDAQNDLRYAFFVELGELSNEVGFFKYWKQSHKMNKTKTLDEWADCFHFLTSIANNRKYTKFIKEVDAFYLWEDYPLKEMFNLLLDNDLNSSGQVIMAYQLLLGIGFKLGFTEEELIKAYETKNLENYTRVYGGY